MNGMLRALVCLSLLSLGGCAWTNRDNRPLWNAFENHLVPDSATAFALTLPLTVPGGLLAILGDTFVVHPIRVTDDAAMDASDVWDSLTIADEHYYTNVATVPFRAIGTPIVFAFSWLGRSLFDVPPYGDMQRRQRESEARRAQHEADVAAEQVAALAAQRAEALAWLQALANGERAAEPGDVVLDDDMRAAMRTAGERAHAAGRLALYRWAARRAPDGIDWNRALGDPSAVVRHAVLAVLPDGVVVAPDVQQRLRADADEAVRLAAAQRFR